MGGQGVRPSISSTLRMEPDGGTTNIRYVKSKHWPVGWEPRTAAWCRSTRSANSTPRGATSGLRSTRAGICVRPEGKEGETTSDLYAFLTIEPNVEVGAVHPKGNARNPDYARRGRDLDGRACRGSPEAAAAASGRSAQDRRPGGQGGPGAHSALPYSPT